MEADGSERDPEVDCAGEEGETVARWGAHLEIVVVIVMITRWQKKMTRLTGKMARWREKIIRWGRKM